MGKRSVTIDPTGVDIALTVHNAGVRDRLVHRTRAGAILTLSRWGLKNPTKHVDAAIDANEPTSVVIQTR